MLYSSHACLSCGEQANVCPKWSTFEPPRFHLQLFERNRGRHQQTPYGDSSMMPNHRPQSTAP